MKIKNLAPDTDVIILESEDGYDITISRDEDGEVHVVIEDHLDGEEAKMILGVPGYTNKL